MKAIKYLSIGLGAVLLLVIIVVAVFVASFDANQYKQELSQLVKQQTGRDLQFDGDIGLTLYPSLGMKLGAMTFANAPGFGEQPMLSVKHASVSVDLLSLLTLQPEIAQLVLDGLSVDLRINRDGLSNWDDLLPQQPDTAETAVEQAPPAEPEPDQPLTLAGAFGGLNITNASLNWVDETSDAEYRIHDLTLQSGRIAPDQAFPLSLAMQLTSPGQIDAEVSLNSEVLLKKQMLKLSALQLQTSARGPMIPVDELELKLAGNAEYSLDKGELGVTGFSTELQTRGGALDSAQVSIAGEIGFDLNRSRLNVAVLDLMAELKGQAVPNGSLKAGLASAQLDLDLNQRALDLQDVTLSLNEDRFEGYIKVLDYAQPAVQFELAAAVLDVDKLLGTATQSDGPQPVSEQAQTEDIEIALPMELLRTLQVDGQVKVNRLLVQGLTLSNVLLKLDAEQGVIDLKPLQMDLYDGRFDGALQLNAQGQQAQYRVEKRLSSFQIGSFLKDFSGDDPISGEASLQLAATTRGGWLSELKSNLNGDLVVDIRDGALKGFNLRHEVERAKAKFRGEKPPPQETRVTDFSALSLSGRIENGVFYSDDLKLQAPLIRVGGKGSVNLVNETVDYQVDSKLVGTSKGQQGGEVDELSGLLIPVAISGAWLSPDIDVLLDEMMKARVKQQLEQEKAAIQRELDAQKAKLKANQEKELAAQKAQMEAERKLKEAEEKAKLEAKIREEKEKAKKELEDKLKKLF